MDVVPESRYLCRDYAARHKARYSNWERKREEEGGRGEEKERIAEVCYIGREGFGKCKLTGM